ncbi:secreted protein [Melampsora americana]|nr:secreted protein [Melampsora americana]
MRINYGFVATSMALLFVLDITNTNSVSASPGAEVTRLIRTIRRRSLDVGSASANDDPSQGEPTGIRPTRQSGVPQLGLSPAMMQRISAGLVSTISKFSADMEAGVEFPTQPEMTQAVDQALATSDYRNFVKVAQAIKNSIDALADRKIAEGETGKSRSKIPKMSTSSSCSPTSAEQIATALLDTIQMFCEQKAQGGKLPNASEVNQALTPALQNIDFSDVKKGAEAVKFGMDHLGTNQGRPLPTLNQKSQVQV